MLNKALRKQSFSYRLFRVINIILMIIIALSCILPLLNLFAISLSDKVAIAAGKVTFWPVEFTTVAYQYLMENAAFWASMLVTLKRVVLGLVVNMLLTVMVAYPLSMSPQKFPMRKYYAWFFIFTMLFGGGLIPTFMVVKNTGLLDSIWALILPGALPVYNMILMLNFFRQIPDTVAEAAAIDGAGHWKILWQIILPMAKPALATIALFVIVAHWNEWFSAIIYMKRTENYPLQTFLQSTIIASNFEVTSMSQVESLSKLSNRTVTSAQIFIGMIPILCVYPFLQKYFTKGIVLGSVKG